MTIINSTTIYILYFLLVALCGLSAYFIYLLLIRRFLEKPKLSVKVTTKDILSIISSIGIIVTAIPTIFTILPKYNQIENDEGKKTIRRFYNDIKDKNNRNFHDAWGLIHNARIDEINNDDRRKKGIPDFDEEAFKKTYATTEQYGRIDIQEDKHEDNEDWYWVSFNVQDIFRSNTLYQNRTLSINKSFENGLINKDKIQKIIMNDLSSHFVIPKDSTAIYEYVMRQTLDHVFGCDFISETGRNLNLKSNDEEHMPTTPVWRHFVQHIQVMKDNNDWKIRSGLARDNNTISEYKPGITPK